MVTATSIQRVPEFQVDGKHFDMEATVLAAAAKRIRRRSLKRSSVRRCEQDQLHACNCGNCDGHAGRVSSLPEPASPSNASCFDGDIRY